MSNKSDAEEKGRPERKARERHHGVGRAGLSQTDRALPTEVEGHQGVGTQGEENLAVDRRDHAKRTVKPGQGDRGDVKR
jgi:hypothetical protein